MDINSALLAVGFIIVAYFVIKKLPHLLALGLTGIIFSFVIIFVVRDVWHLPLEEYVDVSKFDEYRFEGQDYVSDFKDGIKDKESEFLLIENLDEVCNIYRNEGDSIVHYNESTFTKDKIEISYETLNDSNRLELYEKLKGRVEDDRFKEKLFGMNSYVDIKYDLGNAIMYNSKSEKINLVIEFR
jgi:hypothetical protein